MAKYLQDRVTHSRKALPLVMVYGLLVWFASGALHPFYPLESQGLTNFAWVQLAGFLLSAMLMMYLNRLYSLVRVYSRSVSCMFILLSCAACFQFNSIEGHILSLCILSSFLLLFHTFQNTETPGWTFYAFLCIGMASLVFFQVVAYVPLFWLFMITLLNSFGWRTFLASLTGLLTPYWFVATAAVAKGNWKPMIEQMKGLADWQILTGYHQLTVNQLLSLALIVVFALMGIIHFRLNSYKDKFQTRVFYNCFIYTTLLTMAFIALAPAYFDGLLRILIICASPLFGHFIALTYTRATNVVFIVAMVAILLLTMLNLWMPSLTF